MTTALWVSQLLNKFSTIIVRSAPKLLAIQTPSVALVAQTEGRQTEQSSLLFCFVEASLQHSHQSHRYFSLFGIQA